LIVSQLGLDVCPAARLRIARRHDAIPSVEQPARHIRQAHPGDHRQKLTQSTIAQLNNLLFVPLTRYGYLSE
jgi:hypothetical protein